MKKITTFVCVIFISTSLFAQKFSTKSARLSFFSSAPLENIEAVNKSGVALLDASTGDLQYSVLMKGFEFKKALMQEHFNKNYVESDKFPRASFKGKLVNNSSVNYTADGNYPVTVKGQLTIHGVTKEVEQAGQVTIKNGKLTASSSFNITLADYNITIPKMYRDNISKTVKISVNSTLEPL